MFTQNQIRVHFFVISLSQVEKLAVQKYSFNLIYNYLTWTASENSSKCLLTVYLSLQTCSESNSSTICTHVRGIMEQCNSRSRSWKISGIHHTVPRRVRMILLIERHNWWKGVRMNKYHLDICQYLVPLLADIKSPISHWSWSITKPLLTMSEWSDNKVPLVKMS